LLAHRVARPRRASVAQKSHRRLHRRSARAQLRRAWSWPPDDRRMTSARRHRPEVLCLFWTVGALRGHLSRVGVAALAVAVLVGAPVATSAPTSVYRIARVVDGDTVDLTNGAKVRLVQIDTPEVYFGVECYGRRASATTKRLLPPGTAVRLAPEPATDRVDE